MFKHEQAFIGDDKLYKISHQVARDFQIFFGTTTIPNLLSCKKTSFELNLNKDYNYTGKILIDLSKENSAMQLEYKNNNNREVHEIKLKDESTHDDVIDPLLKLSISENVDFIQMFDTSMLLNNVAFDDNTVMECVLERMSEWEQYSRSMAIFDVDSLVGVSENMSDSSMGQSSSYSITNNRLWQQVVLDKAKSNLFDSTGKNHKWVVVITKNEFVSKLFKSLTSFPLTKNEKLQNENSEKRRQCINCEFYYTNAKNSLDSCNYHDGPLIDIRMSEDQITPIVKDHLFKSFTQVKEERQDFLKNYVYLCCYQAFNSSGCKKNTHSDIDDSKDYLKYQKYYCGVNSY